MKEIIAVICVFMLSATIVSRCVPSVVMNAEKAMIIQHDMNLEWENEEWRMRLESEGLLEGNLK